MTKGQLMASIITKLRGKQNAYTIDAIIESMQNDSRVKDIIFDLKDLGVLVQTEDVTREMGDIVGIQFYYALSPFYRQYLKNAPQTEAVKECYEILFPEGNKEVIQGDLFKL